MFSNTKYTKLHKGKPQTWGERAVTIEAMFLPQGSQGDTGLNRESGRRHVYYKGDIFHHPFVTYYGNVPHWRHRSTGSRQAEKGFRRVRSKADLTQRTRRTLRKAKFWVDSDYYIGGVFHH